MSVKSFDKSGKNTTTHNNYLKNLNYPDDNILRNIQLQEIYCRFRASEVKRLVVAYLQC